MNIQMTTLPNGLRVVTANLPGFDSASVAAFIKTGSRNEDESENGVAHMLEHLAFKGTSKRSALMIAAEVENLGSSVNAFTSHNITAYYVNGLGSTVETSVSIIGDILTDSLFDSKELDIERGVILQEIKRSHDDPNSVVYDHFSRTAYPNQAMGRSILGPAAFIENATRENFVSFMDRFYTTRNMVVIGSGNVDHDSFVNMVSEHFAKLPNGPASTMENVKWVGGCSLDTSDKFEQVTALIGWQSVGANNKASFAHGILGSALGSGMSSPLFQEVREKRGLVYSVGASTDIGPDCGNFTLYAGTTSNQVEEVIKVSLGVFLESLSKPIRDEDFLRARNRELVGYATIKERPFSLSCFLAGNLFNEGVIVHPDDRKALIEDVTKDDLRIAARLIFSSNPTVALVGPVVDMDYLGMIKNALN